MENTTTDKYKPTPAEEKLLETLANPEYRTYTVTKICKAAGISRQVYYDAFAKPEFVAYQDQFTRDLLKQSVLPVIRALEKEAKAGSYQHQKLFLEMAGLHTDKQVRELTGALDLNMETLTTDELQKRIELLMARREGSE